MPQARAEWNRMLPLVFWRWHTAAEEAGKLYLMHRGIYGTAFVRPELGTLELDEDDRQEMLAILATMGQKAVRAPLRAVAPGAFRVGAALRGRCPRAVATARQPAYFRFTGWAVASLIYSRVCGDGRLQKGRRWAP